MYGIDYGIDTACFGIYILLSGDKLMKNGWMRSETIIPVNEKLGRPQKIFRTYKTEIDLEYVKIIMTYYPQDRDGNLQPLLLIEFSLPKLINGNNIYFLNDPMEAINSANSIINSFPEMPNIDLSSAILHRLDLACNFQVNALVGEYIRQFFRLTYPKRSTKPFYPFDGVQFYSSRETLIFYGKEEESNDPAASGILRMEVSVVNRRQVRSLVGIHNATIQTLCPDLIFDILDNKTGILGIKNKVIVDPSSALRVLIHIYGIETAQRLYGFLQASQTNNHKQLKALGWKPDVISKCEKAIKKAGLCMAMTDSNKPLPALLISK